jgi:hypothetical protein
LLWIFVGRRKPGAAHRRLKRLALDDPFERGREQTDAIGRRVLRYANAANRAERPVHTLLAQCRHAGKLRHARVGHHAEAANPSTSDQRLGFREAARNDVEPAGEKLLK